MHARLALSTHPIPPHPPTPPSLAVSGSPLPPESRSMPSSAADNSIILHAKTASDVLAQSASHLCEQITSYRKTDFIFEGRYLRYFSPTLYPFAQATLSLSPLSPYFRLLRNCERGPIFRQRIPASGETEGRRCGIRDDPRGAERIRGC